MLSSPHGRILFTIEDLTFIFIYCAVYENLEVSFPFFLDYLDLAILTLVININLI